MFELQFKSIFANGKLVSRKVFLSPFDKFEMNVLQSALPNYPIMEWNISLKYPAEILS